MKINEIFYSLQGEGYYTGTPSVFVRLSGCNLRCPFCDTDHQRGTDLSEDEIVRRVAAHPARHVVVTGGEPSLFLTDTLIDRLHACGKYVAVETNGTHPLPPAVDWITLSPKDAFVEGAEARVVLRRCDEIKLVFTGRPLPTYPDLQATHRFLQPCDVGDDEQNKRLLAQTVDYCLAHPEWRLSLQTHKIIGVQ